MMILIQFFSDLYEPVQTIQLTRILFCITNKNKSKKLKRNNKTQ